MEDSAQQRPGQAPNDQVERRAIALTQIELGLSQSSTRLLGSPKMGPAIGSIPESYPWTEVTVRGANRQPARKMNASHTANNDTCNQGPPFGAK
jgi:hypothetical protein